MQIKVGEVIKAKREELKLTLTDLSKRTGISPGYLSQLENGRKTNPNLDLLIKITRELGIEMDVLLGLEDSRENISLKIPSLLKLIIAKERNNKVLEDKEILKKLCEILDKTLEIKYLINNEELYKMFLEDIYIHVETVLKRYLAFQVVKEMN